MLLFKAMIDADVLVLASPVYFYSIDAQLKAVIDRTVARWLEVKNKEFYYIMTAADEDKSSMDMMGIGGALRNGKPHDKGHRRETGSG